MEPLRSCLSGKAGSHKLVLIMFGRVYLKKCILISYQSTLFILDHTLFNTTEAMATTAVNTRANP